MNGQTGLPREEAFTFPCEGETLLGLLHHGAAAAPAAAAAIGVIVIVGGPQYRAGSHRQFVHLARALAAAGHPVLRFDVRGMGDSSGALHDFEHIGPDIAAAIDALVARAPGVQRVVLWGLCDGASAALLYLHAHPDARVQGLALVNPWVRSEQTQAQVRVKHYYRDRLRSREFWKKLLRGGVGAAAIRGLVQNVHLARRPIDPGAPARPYTQRMAQALAAFTGAVQLTLSGHDYTAREFEEHVRESAAWQAALQASQPTRQSLPEADHTFSSAADKALLAQQTISWLQAALQRKESRA